MPRRRKRPSKYRFARYLSFAMACVAVFIATRVAASAACSMARQASPTAVCPAVALPAFVTVGLWLGIIGSCALAAYQWYRDFVLHDYFNEDH